MSDRRALSSKTVCVVCGERIKRGRNSYSCPAGWAEEFDLVSEDPSRKLRRPRRQMPDRMTFTRAEVKRLVLTARGRGRCAVELLFGLALRKSVLTGLRLGDYDGDYVKSLTKGSKRQVLPISDPWLKVVLDDHWDERRDAELAERDWRAEFLLYPARDMPRRRQDGAPVDHWEDRLTPLSPTAAHVWWGRMITASGVPYRGCTPRGTHG